MLHRYRDVIAVPSRGTLNGDVEVQGMFTGGRQTHRATVAAQGHSPYRGSASHGEPRHMRAMAW